MKFDTVRRQCAGAVTQFFDKLISIDFLITESQQLANCCCQRMVWVWKDIVGIFVNIRAEGTMVICIDFIFIEEGFNVLKRMYLESVPAIGGANELLHFCM